MRNDKGQFVQMPKPSSADVYGRFEKFVERVPEGGCWLWIGGLNADGYGLFCLSKRKQVSAHRWIYKYLVGTIPVDKELDHLCRVRCCVNPAHLEPVFHRENVMRGNGVAAKHAAKTHCAYGHLLEYQPNTNRRFCRECSRASNKRSYWKRKELSNAGD